jgi:hypothetical protein
MRSILRGFVLPMLAAAALFAWTSPAASRTLVPVEEYRASSLLVLEARYDDAEIVFDRFIQEHPNEPSGYLLKAAVIGYEITDYEDMTQEKEYLSLLDTGERLASAQCAVDINDMRARYYLFTAKALRGVSSAPRGSFFDRLVQGREGGKGFVTLIEDAPDLYDAYLGAGSYRFWKSNAIGPIRKLPFIGDDRELGISEVKTAIERGELTGPLANVVLLEMLLAYNPLEAAVLGERLMKRYPECRLFAWQLGESYKKLRRFEEARVVFDALAERYRHDSRDDGSGMVRCWWKMAVLSRDMGNKASCSEYCLRILDLAAPEKKSLITRQKNRIEGSKRYLKEIVDGGE